MRVSKNVTCTERYRCSSSHRFVIRLTGTGEQVPFSRYVRSVIQHRCIEAIKTWRQQRQSVSGTLLAFVVSF